MAASLGSATHVLLKGSRRYHRAGAEVLGRSDKGEWCEAVACNDITDGNNASGTADGYSAGVGFDAVTGWGSPIGTEQLDKLP